MCFSISAKQTDRTQRVGEEEAKSLAGRERSRRGENGEQDHRAGRAAVQGTVTSTRFTSSGSGSSGNKPTENPPVSWFKSIKNEDSWRETHSFLCWGGFCWLHTPSLGRPGSGRSPRPGLRCERWRTDGCPPPPTPPLLGTPGRQPAS